MTSAPESSELRVALAGFGAIGRVLATRLRPSVVRNTHRIVVEADFARFQMTIENVPSGTTRAPARSPPFP